MCPVRQDIKPCDATFRGEMGRSGVPIVYTLSQPYFHLCWRSLFVPCSFPVQSLHKQLGCIDNCIQVVCVCMSEWRSSQPARTLFQDQIRSCCFFFSFFFLGRGFVLQSHTHLTSVQCSRQENGLTFHCCQEDNGGVSIPPPKKKPPVFLSSIHCHCLLIG